MLGIRTHLLPPPKRRRLNPGIRPSFPEHDLYLRLDLEKNRSIYLEEEDDSILTPEWVEWNPAIRRCIGRLPRHLGRRLIYLSRFKGETTIYAPYDDIVLVEHLQDQMYGAYYREARLKRAMRNLLGKWKCWRMDRLYQGVEIDPITLSEPEKPVVVYSWQSHRRYCFDAKALSLHIEAQLCHHSGGYAIPQAPRNPWNNMVFPLRELVTIYLQLKKWGELRWALQTYHGTQFNLTKWSHEQRRLLSRKSLQDALHDLPHLPFLRQNFLEFIMITLEEANMRDMEEWKTVYEYSLEHFSDHPVIQQWGQWYVQTHTQDTVEIDLRIIWKRQTQLSRAILIRERHTPSAVLVYE